MRQLATVSSITVITFLQNSFKLYFFSIEFGLCSADSSPTLKIREKMQNGSGVKVPEIEVNGCAEAEKPAKKQFKIYGAGEAEMDYDRSK